MTCSKLSFILGKVAISMWNLLRVKSIDCFSLGEAFRAGLDWRKIKRGTVTRSFSFLPMLT